MIYLDHNANAPLRTCARRAMDNALGLCGNASSVHAAGRAARSKIEVARVQVAALVDAPPASVVFTSGGSEANALALRGMVAGALAAEDRITRLFICATEHDSVRANAAALAETVPGLRLNEIPVNADGIVDLPALRLSLMQGKGRALVCVMAANNETGVVQDIAKIAKLLKAEAGEDALFHVDAVQAAGRIGVSFNASGADTMALSAHKIGGPQGAGALIVKEGVPLAALIAGGGQESRKRAGTENVAAIAGFGAAAHEAMDFAAEGARLLALRERFERMLKDFVPDAVIFGGKSLRLPNTVNFAIPGLAAETALIALDLDAIAVSSGSACSSGTVKPSHVLRAMGVEENLARGGIRVSFGWNSREDDVDSAIASLRNLVARRSSLAA